MNTLTLRELVAKATPGPWIAGHSMVFRDVTQARTAPVAMMHYNGELRIPEERANAQLIARIASPEVAEKVYEALERASQIARANGDSFNGPFIHEALRLLDGTDAKTL